MFSKKVDGATVLGAGDRIEGTVVIRGRLHIDGEIRGDIEADGEVSIGPDGRVEGEVRAQNVSVAGAIEGTVIARDHLHMLPTGAVRGDAYFQSLQVDRGGVIFGRTASTDELETASPLSLVPGGKDESPPATPGSATHKK